MPTSSSGPVLDAPDPAVRTAYMKYQRGERLSPQEWSRLQGRLSAEGQTNRESGGAVKSPITPRPLDQRQAGADRGAAQGAYEAGYASTYPSATRSAPPSGKSVSMQPGLTDAANRSPQPPSAGADDNANDPESENDEVPVGQSPSAIAPTAFKPATVGRTPIIGGAPSGTTSTPSPVRSAPPITSNAPGHGGINVRSYLGTAAGGNTQPDPNFKPQESSEQAATNVQRAAAGDPRAPGVSFWRNNGDGTSTEGLLNDPKKQRTRSLSPRPRRLASTDDAT